MPSQQAARGRLGYLAELLERLRVAIENGDHLSTRKDKAAITMATMPDVIVAQRKALRRNIERYSRLLETELTEIERAKLHKRMAEDWAVLSRLNQATDPTAGEVRHGTPPAFMQVRSRV